MATTRPATAPARVTAVLPDPRSPSAVRISVEGRITWTVARADAEALGVGEGVVVDEVLRERLLAASDVEGAWRLALRHLGRRSFARWDLGRRLRRGGHPAPAVEAALTRAAAAGLLDDDQYARSYVETRATRGRGPARLRRDLMRQGVPGAVIDRVLRELWPDGEGPEELARSLARRRANQLAGLPLRDKRRRIMAFLVRRGFVGAQARRVVAEEVG